MSAKTSPLAAPMSVGSTTGSASLERLARQRGKTPEQEMGRLRKAAKEFESFFTYQMLKSMRETTLGEEKKEGMFGDGLGKGVFTDMFDMELSKSMSINSPRSLAAVLSKSLEKRVAAEFTDPNSSAVGLHDLKNMSAAKLLSLKNRNLPISTEHHSIELQKLSKPGKISLPAHQHGSALSPTVDVSKPVSEIRARYGTLIDAAASRHGIDSALIEAVIAAESHGKADALSPAGAQGLMQLMPATARDLKVADPFSAADSINGGSKYLAHMLDRFGSLPLALAAYNAGPGRVSKHGGIPPIAETEQYVQKVLSQYETAKQASVSVTPKAEPHTDR